jgi:DNA-binding NtrC family response regulator
MRENNTHVFLGMAAVIVSEPMTRLVEMAERVARSNATVLITGESGTGKEVVARAVHHFSPRSHRAWVDLNCAALPEHLLESELFGYDRGAFSGADTAKPGLFELANNGTIFLDEIGELDMRMQVKLLRVLDGVPYYRLGGVKKVSVDVRIVAATTQDLEKACAEGRFRNDLYHRLCQITLRVPPLRRRREDIAPLANFFLNQHDPDLSFSACAIEKLREYSWPGNIRELRNVVIKAAVLAPSSEIRADTLPMPDDSEFDAAYGAPTNDKAPVAAVPADVSLDGMEKRMILSALTATGGHQQKAAAKLGISRRTLSRKMKLYSGIPETTGAGVSL